MNQVFIVKPKTLSTSDKNKLIKAGHTVIEHPFPQDVRIVAPVEEVNSNIILQCALDALKNSNYSNNDIRAYFANRLCEKFITKPKP